MTQLSYAFTLFLSLFIEAFPFLLLGILVSSWLLVFVNEHQLAAQFTRSRILGAIIGSCLGLLIPVSQYGNIPVARRFLLQGLPLPITVSFLLAAPTINPIVLWLTWKAFPEQPAIIFFRILFAWVIAVVIACIFSTYQDKLSSDEETNDLKSRSTLLRSGSFLRSPPENEPLHRVGNLSYESQVTTNNKPWKLSIELFFKNTIGELLELGSFLILGCAIAAICQVFLPQDALLNWDKTPTTQIIAMLLLGAVLSVGPAADMFLISFLSNSFLKGALLAFLLFSAIIDIKGIVLMFSTFRPKFVFYLLILAGQLTFLFTLLLDFYTS